MSVITEILDRLSGIEIVKEKMRDTAMGIDHLVERIVDSDRQVQDINRRVVRIEIFAEVAKVRQQPASQRITKVK